MNEPAHVLVVDDCSDLRDVLCSSITDLGFRCEVVTNGHDVLGVLDWWKPFVVVIEWNLHDGSCVGLSRKVRNWALDNYRAVLVVMYSQRAESDADPSTEDFDEYIQKPGEPNEIANAILRFISPSGS